MHLHRQPKRRIRCDDVLDDTQVVVVDVELSIAWLKEDGFALLGPPKRVFESWPAKHF